MGWNSLRSIVLCGCLAWQVEYVCAQDDAAYVAAKTLFETAYEAPDREKALDQARAALLKLEESSPAFHKQAEFHLFTGEILDFLDLPDEALLSYAEAEKIEPENMRAVFLQGEVHLYQDRMKQALPFFERAVKMDGEDVRARYALGYSLFETGEKEKAEATFREVLEIDPEHFDARRDLADIHAARGEFAAALEIWQGIVEKGADDLTARWNLAQTLQSMGRDEDAETEFLRYRKDDPNYWRTLEKLIQVSGAQGKTEQREGFVEELYDWRVSGSAPEELAEKVLYVRDQFGLGELKIYALEYFDLLGERAVKYSFSVYRESEAEDEEAQQVDKITLGSYDSTNDFAHSSGEITTNERRYHLDRYGPDGSHATLAFFTGKPDYDVVKEMVIETLEGKRKPLSETVPVEDGAKVNVNVE